MQIKVTNRRSGDRHREGRRPGGGRLRPRYALRFHLLFECEPLLRFFCRLLLLGQSVGAILCRGRQLRRRLFLDVVEYC